MVFIAFKLNWIIAATMYVWSANNSLIKYTAINEQSFLQSINSIYFLISDKIFENFGPIRK